MITQNGDLSIAVVVELYFDIHGVRVFYSMLSSF